ncbi:MAG: retron Eco8 family effector endonuclease [Pseudobutyrivibrio sp.]|nr:retron Eco8 family effector endonuclease [Pseudobutyrivibrio sp.]
MGIERIVIKNYKSLQHIDINVEKNGITCLIGKNGAGKTTIMQALKYYYQMANNTFLVEDIIDNKNHYVQKASVELYFNLSKLRNIDSFKKDIKNIEKFVGKNDIISLKMTQYKTGQVEWYPIKKMQDVRILLSYFPLYLIENNAISSFAWHDIWNIVSDIAISMYSEDDETKTQLLDVFKDIYGDKFERTYKIVNDVLLQEKININHFDYKSRYKNAILTALGGEKFLIDDEPMSYYSKGINSLKYLRLYLALLMELSQITAKEILILLDEPEVNLHPQFIDELSASFSTGKKIAFILSTHSPHLLTNLINKGEQMCFYKVYEEWYYTRINKYSISEKSKKRSLISDNEAVGLFANLIVFVEGICEMQFLNNYNLAEVFPELRLVTFFNTNSNDRASEYLLPRNGDKSIPYLVIIDMDKVLRFNVDKKRFMFTGGNTSINPLANKIIEKAERYSFGDKRNTTFYIREKIKELMKKTYTIEKDKLYIDDSKYEELIRNIKKYSLQHSVVTLKTTIEGLLICDSSLNVFLEWFHLRYFEKNYKKWNDFKMALEEYDRNQQIFIMRSLFNGKLDILYEYSSGDIEEYISAELKDFIDKNKKEKGKTGWINSYIEWLINNHLRDVNDEGKKEALFKLLPEFKYIYFLIKDMLS